MTSPSPTNDIHPTVTSTAPSTKETNAPQSNNINGANTANHHPLPATAITPAPTPVQIALAAILLGTSAGLTLYTKKTSSMLQRMERMNANAVQRRGPEKFGPTTKSEWEKMRNRWGGKDDDDIV